MMVPWHPSRVLELVPPYVYVQMSPNMTVTTATTVRTRKRMKSTSRYTVVTRLKMHLMHVLLVHSGCHCRKNATSSSQSMRLCVSYTK